MRLVDFDELPTNMQTEEVRYYYDILSKKKVSLLIKRCFDISAAMVLLVIFSPIFLYLAIAIKLDSPGPVFYRQVRVTQYGKTFRIHKFRSMRADADQTGTLVTVSGDSRITRIGRRIRDNRLDELGQLIDVIKGDMTFVGIRPEVPRYVDTYDSSMKATLLLPAGITSMTSIYYSGESAFLDGAANPDKTYIEEILPEKMKWNLKSIECFSLYEDVKVMLKTIGAVLL